MTVSLLKISSLEDWTGRRKLNPLSFGGTARLSEVAPQRDCKFIKNITGRDRHSAVPYVG